MKKLSSLLVSSLLTASAFAAPETVIPLWPEGVPAPVRTDVPAAKGPVGPEQVDARGGVTHIAEPTLTVFPAAVDRPTGTAMIICPGGGYAGLSREREGYQFARWLSGLGVTSFILTNRVGDFGYPAPLQDVLRAVRLVRSRAAEFKIDPTRLGVMGSSAGGHLAASAGTLFDHPDGKTGAALDAVSARPDFLILMYPVITMFDPAAHAGSRQQLLGLTPTPAMLDLNSLEKQVTAATPPTLLIHTQEDKSVPIENSILFFQALTKAKVPAEFYAFERGAHGMGLNPDYGTSSDWPKRAEEWLRNRGLLTTTKKHEEPAGAKRPAETTPPAAATPARPANAGP
jgi:acetyl esterase/lipase